MKKIKRDTLLKFELTILSIHALNTKIYKYITNIKEFLIDKKLT